MFEKRKYIFIFALSKWNCNLFIRTIMYFYSHLFYFKGHQKIYTVTLSQFILGIGWPYCKSYKRLRNVLQLQTTNSFQNETHFPKAWEDELFLWISVARQIFFEIPKNISQIGDNAFFSYQSCPKLKKQQKIFKLFRQMTKMSQRKKQMGRTRS